MITKLIEKRVSVLISADYRGNNCNKLQVQNMTHSLFRKIINVKVCLTSMYVTLWFKKNSLFGENTKNEWLSYDAIWSSLLPSEVVFWESLNYCRVLRLLSISWDICCLFRKAENTLVLFTCLSSCLTDKDYVRINLFSHWTSADIWT